MTRRRVLRLAAATVLILLVLYWVAAYLVLPALWMHYEHEPGLEGQPMVTVTADGIPGDPLNVGLVGTEAEAIRALAAAGWYPADAVTLKTSVEIAGSVLFDRPYRDAPVTRSSMTAASRTLPSRSRSAPAPTGGTTCASGGRSNAAGRDGRFSSARRPSIVGQGSATTPARSPTTSRRTSTRSAIC